jgi:hypothetical protein
MDEEQEKKLKEIMSRFHCKKDYLCYKSGYEVLCKTRDIGLESYLECLDDECSSCEFSIPFGDTRFCHCPLRVYICKELKK